MSVHLHIERLICDGLATDVAQHAHIRAELETHLAALFAQFSAHESCALASLAPPPLTLPASASKRGAGRLIAHALHSAVVAASSGSRAPGVAAAGDAPSSSSQMKGAAS